MRFLSSMVIISLIALLTGCFEPTGKVKFDADKGNATFYVDGKEITNKKDGVSVVVGEHTVKAIVPLDKKWKYVGEKKFKVEKDKTTEVYVHTMKVPTEYQKEYEKKLASFDPQAYKFQLPLYLQNIDKQKLKVKVDTLLANKEYGKISATDIEALDYYYVINKLYEKKLREHNEQINTTQMHQQISSRIASLINRNKIISETSNDVIKVSSLDLNITYQDDYSNHMPKTLQHLHDKIKNHPLTENKLNLTTETVYKYGKIGEVYVPSVSYTSSTPQYSTITVGSSTYNKTVYTSQEHTSGGYNTDVQGYTAINRIINNNDVYYLVKIKSTWRGKYTKPQRSSSWSGDEHIDWSSEYQNGKQISSFIIPPHKYVKYQFVVGEEKSPVKTQILDASVVPKEYAEKLYEALNPKNEATVLIDKFLKDERVSAWHNRLKRVKREIIEKRNSEFNDVYKNDVTVKLTLPKGYDADFGGDVVLSVTTPTDMCVYVQTPFGVKSIQANGKKDVTYKKVMDLSSDSDVYVKEVRAHCD